MELVLGARCSPASTRPWMTGTTAAAPPEKHFKIQQRPPPKRRDFQIEVKIITDVNTRQARSR